MIIFVGGLIGAGKSTVAKGLADYFSIHYYDVDEIKKAVFSQDPDYEHNLKHGIPFGDAIRKKVYQRVTEDLKKLRETHDCLVIDETLHKKANREILFEGAKKHFGSYIVIWVKAPEETIIQRLTDKHREGHILADPLAMHNAFLKEFEDFEESLIVCWNENGMEQTLSSLITIISGADELARHRISQT